MPKEECLVADCGELPADTNLSQVATYTAEVRSAVPLPCFTDAAHIGTLLLYSIWVIWQRNPLAIVILTGTRQSP